MRDDDDGATKQVSRDGNAAPPQRDLLLAMWEDRSATLTLPDRGSILIGRDAASLGSGPSLPFVIEHPSVSRKHARIDLDFDGEARQLTITDLGSANGTRVNGRKLGEGEAVAITAGVLVEVGTVVVIVQRRPQVTAPPKGEATRGGDRHPLGILVPTNGPMAQVHRLIEHVAGSNLSVLIFGETGAGKEIAASAIHRFSKRAKGPFIQLNCAALSETLLESELFGHEKGAFTGAINMKVGLIEAADGGTLFLDEIGEMPLATQAKLLRVLEGREVQRVGSVKPRKVDIRIVAATNRDLEAEVRKGTFRLDLFHRLDGVSIALPPLRARKTEILPLARMFLKKACDAEGRPLPTFTREAEQALEGHPWPGNVRELKNVIDRAAVLSMGAPIEPLHLRLSSVGAARAALVSDNEERKEDPGEEEEEDADLDPAEKERILAALEKCGGNQSRAARELGIPRRTLLRRLDAYGVPRPRK